MSELEKELQQISQAMRAKGHLEESETVYRAAMEIQKLREKARLYDEAVGQEPAAWQRRKDFAIRCSTVDGDPWKQCAGNEAADAFNRAPGYEYRELYTKPVPQAMAVPDGWQLVPVVPTDEMCVAGLFAETLAEDDHERHYLAYIGSDAARQAYVLMLKAAPEYKL